MKDHTDITIVLDRSGSMSSIKTDTIGGYNEFMRGQKAAGDNASLTLVQFDSEAVDLLENAVPIAQAKALTDRTFVPRGLTPLLDALGQTLVGTGKRLGEIAEDERPDKVLFVIITDGYENASREYTREQIRSMIEHQQTVYKWQFVYLGKGIDSFAEAGSIGISRSATSNYTGQTVGEAYSNTMSNVAKWRHTNDAGSLTYTDDQRAVLDPSNAGVVPTTTTTTTTTTTKRGKK